MTEPSEEAFAVAEQIVLGNQGVSNAALIIDAALAAAREDERAKVVAWFRGGGGKDTSTLDRTTRALFLRGMHSYADAIARHEHLNPR